MSARESFSHVVSTTRATIARPRSVDFREAKYTVKLAESPDEIDAALRLRFDVFNIELNEGLEASYITGRDEDQFDRKCSHLVVVENASRRVVGTYRIQTLEDAGNVGGFYSSSEFDLSRLPENVLAAAVETGRACIAREHRNSRVLFLLWKGISRFVLFHGKRFVFGCCSLPTTDPAVGAAVFQGLSNRGCLHREFGVTPRTESTRDGVIQSVSSHGTLLPKLFESYLKIGAKICGEPVVDHEFRTTDFFIIVDRENMPEKYRRMFFG